MGTAHLLQLTQNNGDTMKDHINTESLPKTFRRAIVVAKQLGVRYIWIDSLCIIQDFEQRLANRSVADE
jgi:hypothetical protein